MPYVPAKHGRAEYSAWSQLTSGQIALISEGPDNIPLSAQKFAHLVYQVNPVPINLSGEVIVDAVKIEDVHGHKANITVQGQLETLATAPQYSTIVKTSGNYTYVMNSAIGAGTSGEAIWQMQRIFDDGAGTTEIMWADGNNNYDNAASAYLIKSYSF